MKKLIIPKNNLAANTVLGAVISDGTTVNGLQNGVEYQAFNLDNGSQGFTPVSQYTNAYAKAWAARLPVKLSDARASLFDTLFNEINAIIPKLDALYIFHGAEDRGGAKLNLVQDRFNLTEALPANLEFSPTSGFNIKAGSTGGASQYLDTGINFATTTGLKSALNNRSFGIGAFSVVASNPANIGNFSATATGGLTFFSLGAGSRLDSTSTRNSPGILNTGHAAIIRSGGSDYIRYLNSAALETINVASSSPVNDANLLLLSRGIAGDGASNSPLAYMWTGSGLTESEYQTLYYALNRFYAALGAEPLAARLVQGSLTSS